MLRHRDLLEPSFRFCSDEEVRRQPGVRAALCAGASPFSPPGGETERVALSGCEGCAGGDPDPGPAREREHAAKRSAREPDLLFPWFRSQVLFKSPPRRRHRMKPSLLLLPALVASWSLTPDKTRGSLDPEDYALALAEGWYTSKTCDDLDYPYGRVTNKECDSYGMDEEMKTAASICDKSYFGGSDPNALSCDHSCDWPMRGEDKYTTSCDGDCDLGCTHPCEAAKPWKKNETSNWSYKANSCDSSCDYGRSVWGWDETKEEWDQGRMGRKRKLQPYSKGCDESCDWGCHSAGELFQAAVNQIPEPIGKATGVLAEAVENLAKQGGCELSKKDLYEIIGDAMPSFAGMQTNLSLFKELATGADEVARLACTYMWNGPFAKYKLGGEIVAGIRL